MRSLMMFAPNPTDATSFYRAVGPLQHLKRKMGFQLQVGSDVNWATLKGTDAVFLQRPSQANHCKIIDMARDNGKPVWVDYDDDLFAVPRSNRTYRIYNSGNIQNNIAQCLAKADVVTVSTETLRKKFSEILELVKAAKPEEEMNLDSSKIHVVPNAYDTDFAKGEPRTKQNKLVYWRGSGTHDKDLLLFTKDMKRAVANHLDWTFNFIGESFWHTIEELSSIPNIKDTNIIETESLDPTQYWKMIYLTNPALVMVPLWDCPLNRAKSNIAWLEGIHAGAACLGPNWDEWQRPGVIHYDSPKDFGDKLDLVMRGEFDTLKLAQQGREYVMDTLTLDRVNLMRQVILESLWR